MKIRSSAGSHSSRKRPPLFTYLMYILVATVVFTGVTFSGYISTSSGGDEARVAMFKITEEVGTTEITETFTVPTVNLIPGQSIGVDIKVKNTSEVAVDYTITVANDTGNLPLKFLVNDSAMSENGGRYTFTGEMAYNKTENYKLTVLWPTTYASPDYAGMVDTISITLDAVQKD